MISESAERIRWFHKKILGNEYPNATRLANKFEISSRQAQRDISSMKTKFGAPLEYVAMRKGYTYASPFSLPEICVKQSGPAYTSKNKAKDEIPSDETFVGETYFDETYAGENRGGETSAAESQSLRKAEIMTDDPRALGGYIRKKTGTNLYLCEFHDLETFISRMMSANADIKVVKPDWLCARIIRRAERIIQNNLK